MNLFRARWMRREKSVLFIRRAMERAWLAFNIRQVTQTPKLSGFPRPLLLLKLRWKIGEKPVVWIFLILSPESVKLNIPEFARMPIKRAC